ncbi:FAD-dependent oxidoreductase [Chloroflexota bacterium]
MHQLKSLFEPIKVGEIELKNRIVMAAMGLGYCPEGKMTERMINFCAARAEGGVGLILCNLGDVTARDENIPGLRKFTDAVHAHGAKIGTQLVSSRMWARDKGASPELIAPSDFAPPRGGRPSPDHPRPLTIEEIEQIVEEKGREAQRIREAGFDAIEIHANVGVSLISYFISPLTNLRTDRYGGSLENRYRLLLEVLDSAKKHAGSDFTVMCRISGTDFLEGGYSLEDSKMAAPMLEKAGICALDVTTGWHEAPVPSFQMGVPQGNFIYLAEEVKKVVNIPVIGGTKVVEPALADQFIADGRVDMVYMARPFLADPELPNKAKEGRLDEIRTCFACGYCFDAGIRAGKEDVSVYCAINAQTGREAEYTIEPTQKPRRVLVVGGGPAGMEAARVAALRGHQVTLVEKEGKLGGMLNIAAIPPSKEEDIGHLTKYFSRQMELRGIDVKLNQEATPEFIGQSKSDVVIVATGASALIPDIPGVNGSNVANALDVLAGARETGERVIIIGGGLVGCETAEFLAEKGKKVTIIEMLRRIGDDIGASYRWVVMQRLRSAGVRMEASIKAEEITGKGVRASREDGSSELFEGDTVVLAAGLKCDDELSRQLEGKVASLYSVGDCVEPHRVAEAVESAFKVAREI